MLFKKLFKELISFFTVSAVTIVLINNCVTMDIITSSPDINADGSFCQGNIVVEYPITGRQKVVSTTNESDFNRWCSQEEIGIISLVEVNNRAYQEL